MEATKINGTGGKVHGLIASNARRQKAGAFDRAAVAARGDRAKTVLAEYALVALGSKVNGWGEVVEAYSVTKPDGKGYEVQVRLSGQTSCNCPDWVYRRKAHAGVCKHGLAVLALRRGQA